MQCWSKQKPKVCIEWHLNIPLAWNWSTTSFHTPCSFPKIILITSWDHLVHIFCSLLETILFTFHPFPPLPFRRGLLLPSLWHPDAQSRLIYGINGRFLPQLAAFPHQPPPHNLSPPPNPSAIIYPRNCFQNQRIHQMFTTPQISPNLCLCNTQCVC